MGWLEAPLGSAQSMNSMSRFGVRPLPPPFCRQGRIPTEGKTTWACPEQRIRGEKRQEEEKKSRNYHRVERSYGSFRRTLSLPDDAARDSIAAEFKNGMMTVTIPRKSSAGTKAKQIEVKTGK